MNTPIYDFLKKYSRSDMLRCHMPGHKGRDILDGKGIPSGLDITEINGADSLFEAGGIILESEQNTAELYGTAASFYSAGGSTLCIQAMLAAMKYENRKIIAVRNVHKAFLNAAALLDLDVIWIMPEYTSGILSGKIRIDDVEQALSENPDSCLYVTSPDYTGRLADIKALSKICRQHNAPLLIDNAHGAHLNFFPESIHPMALGADICCDSAHKMLPALTGAAILHTSQEKYVPILRKCMSIFGSTSPSYLVMASLDLCSRYISENIRQDIENNLRFLRNFREKFSGRLVFASGEPFHITINAAESGFNGNELADMLRKNGVECEYSDCGTLILLMSPVNKKDDYEYLAQALENSLNSAEFRPRESCCILPELPRKAMSIRQAVFSPCEDIPVEAATGRICGAVSVPCPPAVPIAASGEIIDEGCINIFKNYSIPRVNVVK